MPDSYFQLSTKNQASAIDAASDACGRAPHLLEKDIWVVWALSALFESGVGSPSRLQRAGRLCPRLTRSSPVFLKTLTSPTTFARWLLDWFAMLPKVLTPFRQVAASRRNGPTKSAGNFFQLGFAITLTHHPNGVGRDEARIQPCHRRLYLHRLRAGRTGVRLRTTERKT